MSTTHFCLIRHGETPWNAEGRLQGHTDIPLNSHGQEQATQMARALKTINFHFDVLYTSDLQRAADTANAIVKLFGKPAVLDEALRERHFGALQGLKISEASRIRPSIWEAHLARDLDHDLEGGESISQFAIRIEHALERIKQAHIGKTICLVSHGGVLDMIYRIVSQQALNTHRVASVPNASLNHIAHDGQRWMIEKWADTSHLMDAALDNVDL